MNGIKPVTVIIVLVGGHRIGELIGTAGVAQEAYVLYIRTTFSYPFESSVDVGYLRRKYILCNFSKDSEI